MTIWQKVGWVIGICVALYVSLASLLAGAGQLPLTGWRHGRKQANIVFVMSDDQDMHMDSLSYMPLLKKHIIDEGTFFQRHYCTVALCCPSRASLLTGKAAHNTNVTDINPPYGRFEPRISDIAVVFRTQRVQVDILSSSARVSMKRTSPFGFKLLATTHTTLGSSSTRKLSLTMIRHMLLVGLTRTSCSTHTRTATSTPPSREIKVVL